MNTLRTLPLLRPSRSSSPAPGTTSDVHAHATMGPPALPGSDNSASAISRSASQPGVSRSGVPRSRSLSKPLGSLTLALGTPKEKEKSADATRGSSGSIASTTSERGTARTANTSRSGISPPGSKPPTPRQSTHLLPGVASIPPPTPSPAPGAVPGAATAPGGGYIDAIGLRLNELVNKTCAGVDPKAKRGIKKGMGWSLGEGVVKELPSPDGDAYLLRAVIRTSIRSLTIYVSRLEYAILPSLTDPAFATSLSLGPVSATSSPLNASHAFALSLCHAAWETCEVLELALEKKNPPYPRFVHELLRPTMDKLDSVVAKVVTPLMGNLKKELLLALEATGQSPVVGPAKVLPSGTSTPTTAATPSTILPHKTVEKSINNIPASLRPFASKVDSARKTFDIVCKDCKEDGEAWVASVVVAVIWKGIVKIGAKYGLGVTGSVLDPFNSAPNPEQMTKALAALVTTDTKPATPAVAGPVSAVGKMVSILPSRAASRPPSPPHQHAALNGAAAGPDPTAQNLATFEALVAKLVHGLFTPALGSPASEGDSSENLAREALAEAIEAIKSYRLVVTSLETTTPGYICDVLKALRDDTDMSTAKDEETLDAMEDVPAILLFHLLRQKTNIAIARLVKATTTASPGASPPPTATSTSMFLRSPAEVWGMSVEDYERQVLSGFGVAEERARRVAGAVKTELERVTGEIGRLVQKANAAGAVNGVNGTGTPVANGNGNGNGNGGGAGGQKALAMETRLWLRACGLALQARTGVVPAVAY